MINEDGHVLLNEKEYVQKAYRLILSYFKDDEDKTKLWFKTTNPALGGVSPTYMIYCGRVDKLVKYIECALDGNTV